MSLKDPNWGKNIISKHKTPALKGSKPNPTQFQHSLGLNHYPKERHNIEKVFVRKRLPPPKFGQTYGHGNYSPGKPGIVDDSFSKEISRVDKDSFLSD